MFLDGKAGSSSKQVPDQISGSHPEMLETPSKALDEKEGKRSRENSIW